MEKYDGHTVLVTGSRRGVGRIITEHFLKHSAQVIGIARNVSDLDHENYHHFEIDICDAVAIQNLFGQLRSQGLSVDIVINNAAVLTSQYAMIMPMKQAQDMVNTNLLAPFHVSREAAKMMRKNQWGRIINIGSMATSLETQGDSIYAACKVGLTTMANVMAKEFSKMNITCNTIGITAIDTGMLQQLPPDRIDEVIANIPIPRYATADDILNVIDFFASKRSSYITAQNVFLGGIN